MSRDNFERAKAVAQIQALAVRELAKTKGQGDVKSILEKLAQDDAGILPYFPTPILPVGTGPETLVDYWPTFKDGTPNLAAGLARNLTVMMDPDSATRGTVADNSMDASDNMINHIADAADAFTSGNMHDAITNAGAAVGDCAQVFGHLAENN